MKDLSVELNHFISYMKPEGFLYTIIPDRREQCVISALKLSPHHNNAMFYTSCEVMTLDNVITLVIYFSVEDCRDSVCWFGLVVRAGWVYLFFTTG